MDLSSTNRRGPWLFAAAIAAALVAGTLFVSQGAGSGAGPDRSLEPALRAADPAESGEQAVLAAPLAGPAESARVAATAPDHEHDAALGAALGAAEAREACVLEGLLRLPRGFPAAEVVLLHAWSLAEDSTAAPLEGTAGTDRSFRFDAVPAGEWTVVALARSGERLAWGRSTSVAAVPGGHVVGVWVELQEYFVEGVVTDRNGLPLAGITVGYGWRSGDDFAGRSPEDFASEAWIAESYTSFDPVEFRDSDLTGAIVAETLVAPSELTEQAAQESQEYEEVLRVLEATLSQAETGQYVTAGTVEFSSSTLTLDLSSVRVVSSIRGLENWNVPSRSDLAETVVTDAAGAFRIALRGPGQVDLTAPVAPDGDAAEWIPESRSVTLDAESPDGRADFELRRAARIQGRLVRSDGQRTGISVFVRGADGGSTRTRSADDEGAFSFGELPPGRYLFYARSGGSEGQDFSLHLAVDALEGATATIDDVLTPSSSLAGVLQDAGGQPLASFRVEALGADNDNLARSAITDASGVFEMVGLYACDYRLRVRGCTLIEEHVVSVPPHGARADVGVVVVE